MNSIAESYYKKSLDKWGKPQVYKNIKLHPIKIVDEDMYYKLNDLMGYNKNRIPDKDVLKMSYMKFICYTMSIVQEKDLVAELEEFMKYITKEDVSIIIEYKKYPVESIADFSFYMIVNEISYTESDFDNIREMILQQNGLSIEYVNEFDPTLEDSLAFINRKNNHTLEDEVFAMSTGLCVPISHFEDYTYYQFKKQFDRLCLFIDYNTLKPLEASGQISFKSGGVNHWLHHFPEKGRYDSVLIGKSNFTESSDLFKDGVSATK